MKAPLSAEAQRQTNVRLLKYLNKEKQRASDLAKQLRASRRASSFMESQLREALSSLEASLQEIDRLEFRLDQLNTILEESAIQIAGDSFAEDLHDVLP